MIEWIDYKKKEMITYIYYLQIYEFMTQKDELHHMWSSVFGRAIIDEQRQTSPQNQMTWLRQRALST